MHHYSETANYFFSKKLHILNKHFLSGVKQKSPKWSTKENNTQGFSTLATLNIYCVNLFKCCFLATVLRVRGGRPCSDISLSFILTPVRGGGVLTFSKTLKACKRVILSGDSPPHPEYDAVRCTSSRAEQGRKFLSDGWTAQAKSLYSFSGLCMSS